MGMSIIGASKSIKNISDKIVLDMTKYFYRNPILINVILSYKYYF